MGRQLFFLRFFAKKPNGEKTRFAACCCERIDLLPARILVSFIFTTLVQTSKLLGVNAYAYLRDRIARHFELPSLAATIEGVVNRTSNQIASG